MPRSQLTGLIVTKLDGTAKGGVLAAIALWSRSRAGAALPVYFYRRRREARRPADLSRARVRAGPAQLSVSRSSACSGGGSAGEDLLELVGPGRAAGLSDLDRLRPGSSRGRCRRTGRSAGEAATVGASSTTTAPAIATAAPVVSGRRLTRASWSCWLARPACAAAACRGRPRSSAAAPRSRRAPECWLPPGHAPPGRARARSFSLICSIGGRISTTAITCEVTSQMTKVDALAAEAAHPLRVRIALGDVQEPGDRHLRQDHVAGQGELEGAEGDPLRRAQHPRRLRRPGGEGVHALGRLLLAHRRPVRAAASHQTSGRAHARAITGDEIRFHRVVVSVAASRRGRGVGAFSAGRRNSSCRPFASSSSSGRRPSSSSSCRCICSNWLSRRLTSCTCTPAPAAMRRLRVALSSSGLRRSSGVIEQMMPSMRRTSRSARSMSAGRALARHAGDCGQLVHQARRGRPSSSSAEICDRKSLRSKPSPALDLVGELLRRRDVDALLHFLDQRRRCRPCPARGRRGGSASKTSRPSIFSLTPANLIGAPVICAHRQRRAAARVAVQSWSARCR